ncbi:MHYT domain-containing protein [Brevundimonas sp.]|uniref:MHYT domain-containing protein n=1 Tax=Brevundimonas sp. TaxID=1871086 RepID=UPI002897C3A7|nr:MHYT domain-containing protein [Brevundimonas sp.]
MHHSHDVIFIAMSVGVAILASWTSLGLLERVRESLQIRRLFWLVATGLCMGGGIWTMHFVAMLGFQPGVAVTYDMALTIMSFVLAAAGTCGAFWAAANSELSRRNLLIAGAAMGASIALMHYVGMAAVQTEARLTYNPVYVALSVLVAILASLVALLLVRKQLEPMQRLMAAILLGLAVTALHRHGGAKRLYSRRCGAQPASPASVSRHRHHGRGGGAARYNIGDGPSGSSPSLPVGSGRRRHRLLGGATAGSSGLAIGLCPQAVADRR